MTNPTGGDVPHNDTVIRLVYTAEDVRGIAAENNVPFDVALQRAESWGKHIGDTAAQLIVSQLESAIVSDQP